MDECLVAAALEQADLSLTSGALSKQEKKKKRDTLYTRGILENILTQLILYKYTETTHDTHKHKTEQV